MVIGVSFLVGNKHVVAFKRTPPLWDLMRQVYCGNLEADVLAHASA